MPAFKYLMGYIIKYIIKYVIIKYAIKYQLTRDPSQNTGRRLSSSSKLRSNHNERRHR